MLLSYIQNMKPLFLLVQSLLLAFSLGLVNAGSVHADDDHERARELREAGEILPLETILDQVRAQGLGRVLEVELKREHGRYVYELEVVDDQGIVRELHFDARSGQLLKSRRDDD